MESNNFCLLISKTKDSQRTPNGLPANSQRTPSRLPADSQWTPSRLPADSKQVPIWRAYLKSSCGELFWSNHLERPLNELICLLTCNMAKWSSSKGTSMY